LLSESTVTAILVMIATVAEQSLPWTNGHIW
jgi:hypothetical protein